MTTTVTLIKGDGIGPEIIHAVQKVIHATGVKINWEVCEAGAEVFKKGLATGIPQETIESIKRTHVVLKGPLETPIGYGEKSANVTLRALFETYANIRPVKTIPGLNNPYADQHIDFVVVRENVEDLYAGIEYLQTPTVAEGLKIITRLGSEKIIRFAFELARAEGRKKVHCATKANILKITEGLFKKVFEEVSKDYLDIEAHHIIIDNCAHQMVLRPETFDVIVTTNLHGDIISDLGSGLVGGLGVAPAANIGNDVAIFEAVHGSAPKYAGLNVINPTALLLTAVSMLRYLKEFEAASQIEQSILYSLGVQKAFLRDLDKASTLTTTGFTDIVIENLDKKTDFWEPRPYKPIHMPKVKPSPAITTRHTVGVDVFLESNEPTHEIGKKIEQLCVSSPFDLKMISNRGVQVYPETGGLPPDTVDHWRVRLLRKDTDLDIADADILGFLKTLSSHFVWMHIEKLYEFNGEHAFTKAQGES